MLCPTHTRKDRDNLFFSYNLSYKVWCYLQIDWSPGVDMRDVVLDARRSFTKPFFTEVVFTACWNIWITRNAKVFRNERPSFNRWRGAFVHDISLLAHRIKPRSRDELIRGGNHLGSHLHQLQLVRPRGSGKQHLVAKSLENTHKMNTTTGQTVGTRKATYFAELPTRHMKGNRHSRTEGVLD